MNTLQESIERLEAKIKVMSEKYDADPCWMNETLLECMLRDYESKQRLLIKQQST